MPIKRTDVPIESIVSDYDGRTYSYPRVFDDGLEFTPGELAERVYALGEIEPNKHGLRGIHLSPKLEGWLSSGANGFTRGHEYDGFEWLTNIKDNPEAVKRGNRKPRQLKLLSKQRYWSDIGWAYRGDLVCRRFAIHPESGEFVGRDLGQHASQISSFGSYPLEEYIRLAYGGSEGRDPDTTVLLSRTYYNPQRDGENYNFEKDRELSLHVLALLVINGLPEDTKVGLSPSRQTFKYWGID